MDLAQFTDPISLMCLAGAVVASWCLKEEGLGGRFEPLFIVMTNIFVTEFSEFSENIQRKLN